MGLVGVSGFSASGKWGFVFMSLALAQDRPGGLSPGCPFPGPHILQPRSRMSPEAGRETLWFCQPPLAGPGAAMLSLGVRQRAGVRRAGSLKVHMMRLHLLPPPTPRVSTVAAHP